MSEKSCPCLGCSDFMRELMECDCETFEGNIPEVCSICKGELLKFIKDTRND